MLAHAHVSVAAAELMRAVVCRPPSRIQRGRHSCIGSQEPRSSRAWALILRPLRCGCSRRQRHGARSVEHMTTRAHDMARRATTDRWMRLSLGTLPLRLRCSRWRCALIPQVAHSPHGTCTQCGQHCVGVSACSPDQPSCHLVQVPSARRSSRCIPRPRSLHPSGTPARTGSRPTRTTRASSSPCSRASCPANARWSPS